MSQSLTQQRIRIRFGKQGPLRFVGHLDLAKTWERVLRRTPIALEYSQGFNPRPRMQFAAALPVGVTSESEYLDVWLTARLDDTFEEWIERLAAVSPSGLLIHDIADVPVKQDALPTLVTHADYVITPVDAPLGPDELQRRVEGLLAAPTLERTRNKKSYDLRPLIIDLAVSAEGQVRARLMAGDQGMGRPDELLDALGLELSQARIHRQRLTLKE